MIKKNSFIKKFNKLLISINERIESFFNRIRFLVNLKRKRKINLTNVDKKIPIIFGSIVILVLSYFLIPTFYDNNLVKTKLESQILDKYNLQVRLEGPIRYGLFPKPHFRIKDTILSDDGKDIAKSSYIKIFISIKNFFGLEDIKLEDLFFDKTEFNINYDNFKYFKKILNSNKTDHNLKFKKSILFYRDSDEDIIFLTSINNLDFHFNEEFKQELNANLEIFNIPFKINITNDLLKNKTFANIESHKLRLNIENYLDYSKKESLGSLIFKIINRSKTFNYNISKNFLSFNLDGKKFNGNIYFKPFYFFSNLEFHQLDLSKIFEDNSIFINFLDTEILYNQNLNAHININFDKIKDAHHLKDISLKTFFEEGNIIIKDSIINWKDSVLINLNNIELINDNNKIKFIGSINLEFNDVVDFYRHYQVKKANRKKIKKITFNFLLNLYEKEIEIDNLKIDGKYIKNLDNFINNFNSEKVNIFNKVIFRNSIKEFFSNFN